MSISWEEPVAAGAAPCARSGHTFTSCGGSFFVFGGSGRCNGKAQTFNDLFELDTSTPEEYKWKQMITTGSAPPPRARHCAVALSDKHLLVFGGLDKRIRYNDAWVFSLEDKEWSQLQFEGPCPEPRAHLTATKFGSRVFFFGGYGGAGQVFSDLWTLRSCDSGSSAEEGGNGSRFCARGFKWENLTEQLQGTGPSPRFDHTAFIYPVTPNSDTFDKLLIMGGRDLSAMLHDSYVLDLASMTWQTEGAPLLPFEVCNNVCDDIESVPYHKVFSFGGKKGMMQYMNTVEVMDCGSQVWSTPPVDGGKAPCGRCAVFEQEAAQGSAAAACRQPPC
eukprot:GHRQ01021442.1.p1 GENE.GHRQ01021442.1~~GHRQ01021442.1.p1  ORF type:complete len:333 (+),score=100.02 GHRQ01021442.1:429-1427(+)